ncbi:MAG: HPr family phosphocarrier protein [bacterium]
MAENILEKTFEIKNKLGLHARPAALFVQLTNKYKSSVKVSKDKEEVNGKSIMGLMMLAAEQGSRITVTVQGEDAGELLDKIEEMIAHKFEEE